MFLFNTNYISQDYEKAFANFKYKGGTDSFTYEYLWGPLAEKFLNFIPLWMAPNLITLISLILISVTHIVFMFVGSNQEGIASWKLILMASSILIYQNLDNLDGKQARRTKTGSPLGMLFDHGVDSLASFLITIQILEIIRIKNQNIIVLALFFFIMTVFFSALWNQYSTGVFKLGRINPVDEGLPSYALFAIASCFIDMSILQQYHMFAPLNQQLLICLGGVLFVLLVSMNQGVLKNSIRPKQDVLQALCLPILIGASLCYTVLMNKQVYYQKIGSAVSYSLMFFWSRNMIELQLYYVTGQKFNVFNLGTNVFLFSHMGYLVYEKFLSSQGISPQIYFWSLTFINFIVFLEFVISVFRQGSKILGINVFTIKNKSE